MPDFSAGKVYVQVLPSLSGWRDDVQKQLKSQMKGVDPSIELRPTIDKAKLSALQRQIDAISRDATVNVKLNVQGADKLSALRNQLGGVGNRDANVRVDDGGSIDLLSTRLQRLIALSIAASGALGGLGAGAIALGAGAVVGGAGLAALAVGASNIVGAMKAADTATRQAGQTAAQEAAQQVSSANQVANAKDALANATRNAASSVRTALQTQARAEDSLRFAQVAALRAQQALTNARKEATRSLEDMQNQVVSDSLAQREAVLDVQEAQEELDQVIANPAATQRQREEAQLTFDQARQRLAEISLSYQRSQVDAAEAARAGVDGSREVIAAQDNLAQAQRSVRDAQVSAAEAARKVDEARLDGAQQLAQAQRSLQQAQAQASVQAVKQGEAHVKALEAMEKLSPEALRLALFLKGQSGEWQNLSKAAQQFAPGLQRGLEQLTPFWGQIQGNVATISKSMGEFFEVVIGQGLTNAGPFFDQIAAASTELFPRFGESVNTAADAVGGLVLEMLPLAPQALDTVDAVSRLVESWTPFIAQATGPLLEALRNVIRDAEILGPVLGAVAEPAADLTSALSGGLRDALAGLISEGHLNNFLSALIDLVETLSPLIGDAGQLAGVLGQSLVPAIRIVDTVLTPLVWTVDKLVDLIDALPQPVLDVVAGFIALRLAAGPIAKLFEAMGSKAGTAATGLGLFALNAGVSDRAATGVANAGQKVGTALSKMGTAVPIAGVAFIGLTSVLEHLDEQQRRTQETADKLGEALIRGGSAGNTARVDIERFGGAARKFNADLGVSGRVLKTFGIDVTGGFDEIAKKAEESFKRQRDSMTEVQIKQQEVNQAHADYDRSLREFGPTASSTIFYHEQLAIKTQDLKRAQWEAEQATKSHTERLQDQQDQILGMVDANIGFQRSGIRLREAQERYNKAVKEHGENSEYARVASLDLAEAQARYVAASANASVAAARAGGAFDTTTAKTKGTNDALIDLLRMYGDTLPVEMLSMAAHLSPADQAFYGLGVRVDTTGRTILSLPGTATGPPVNITFTDNIPVVQQHVQDLRTEFEKLVTYLTTTGIPAIPPALGPGLGLFPQVTPRATGGLIPGRGNVDSIHALLTPGEYVFSKPAVQRIGAGRLDRAHRMARYAQGGLVGPLRFADGGTVPPAAAGAASALPLAALPLGELPAMFGEVTASITPLVAALVGQLAPALGQVLSATAMLSVQGQGYWRALTGAVGGSVGTITGSYFAALRSGLSLVSVAVGQTAQAFAVQWGTIRAAAATPVRWVLTYPVNLGIVAAWNRIDADFALGKQISPVPIPFASGGRVPGFGNRDSVKAYLTPGEYVLSKPAIANLGGVAAVDRLHEMARAGIIGPSANLGERGDAGRRLRLMQTVPLDGLGFAYGGVQPHVAVAGQEIERVFGRLPGGIGGVGARPNASDHPSGHALDFMTLSNSLLGDQIASYLQANAVRLLVKYLIWKQQFNDGGGWSGMADRGSITANHFDHVHASFLRAGEAGRPLGGVGFFDPAQLIGPYFADTYRFIGQITSLFAGVISRQSAGMATQMADLVKQAAITALSSMSAGAAVAGSPEVTAAVRAVAASFGWGSGPQWDALSWLIGRESSWNPAAANPRSSARGLFQKMVSIHGPLEPTVAGQTQWGLTYIRNRYGDPVGAQRFHMANNWYDNGGYLPPGITMAYNGTGHAERVLTRDQELALAGGTGGAFTGELYLDSGEFLGKVRGEVHRGLNNAGLAISRRTR